MIAPAGNTTHSTDKGDQSMEFERISPITHERASSAPAMSGAQASAVADRAAGHFPI